MLILKWIVFCLFIVGTVFRVIGDHKEPKRFGPFIIASLVFYSIGLIVSIIGLIISLN